MKRLVCSDEIMKAVKAGQKAFFVDENTIITPSARDAANTNGITLTNNSQEAEAGKTCSTDVPVCKPSAAEPAATGCGGIDKDVIYKVLKAMADSGLLKGLVDTVPAGSTAPYQSEKDPTGLKVVRGSTVRLDAFFPDQPDTKVYYQELIDKNDSTISSGIVVIDHSTYNWTQNYDENDYVIEGTMVVTMNGRTYAANAGDCIFIPKGATVTMGSKDCCCKVFYNTYPSNWADML